MSTINAPITSLPWSAASADERRFHRIVIIALLVALAFTALMVVIDAPKVERAAAEKVPPRLAKMLVEKKKVEPPKIELPKPEPEKPKPEEEKPEPKPEPEKPKPEEPKPQPKPEPVAETPQPQQPPKPDVEAARKKAASSGVLAMKDMLADLREAAPVAVQQPGQKLQTGGGEASAPSRSILTSKATAGSGGIDTSRFSRDTGGSAPLASHETATVTSRLDSIPAVEAQKRADQDAAKNSGRSEAEIHRILEANRSAIWSIYQRALRQNPAMQGRVVFKITIDPSGEVSDCTIVSSELGDAELERKLALRIKRIDFGAKDVESITTTSYIDFLPNL